MSSDILKRVLPFAKKADELFGKGHLLRAAENFGRAAEAARPLGADNLVMLQMQLMHSNMLGVYATSPDAVRTADPIALGAHRAECIALISGAVAGLERRRMAGTLLDGKCSAAEEAWRTVELRRLIATMPAADAASFAALTGYEDLLRAAADCSALLLRARMFFAAECSSAQLQSFAEFVVHAVDQMQQPRRLGDAALLDEAKFVDTLRDVVAQAGLYGLDARLVQLLTGAWQRLQRSGVLQVRRIDACIAKCITPAGHSECNDIAAAFHKSMNAPGLRRCALPGCGAKEAHPAHFKSCAACRGVVYCCREHQVEGWPAHKKACKAARKAAAAEDDGAGPSNA